MVDVLVRAIDKPFRKGEAVAEAHLRACDSSCHTANRWKVIDVTK